MKRFSILIEETLQRIIDVEATTLEEAVSKAQQMYYNEEVVLDSGDYVNVEFKEQEETDA